MTRYHYTYKAFHLSFISWLSLILILIMMFQPLTAGSSLGDSIDLLSTIICTTVDVSDWCVMNPTYGSWKCVMEQLASGDAATDIP